jgi:Tfp pilus assembly protein PilN
VCAALVYLIISIQRNSTSNKRDKEKENLDKRIALLEQRMDKIDELDLSTKLAQIQTDLNWIKDKMQDK